MDGILEPANFWIWTVGPLILYAIERTIRVFRGKQSCIIIQAIAHPSRVLELRMKKTTFNYRPGQYVFMACPYIANYEWHPFTISSSPDEDFVSCHIRLAGDWTGKLHALMNPNKKNDGVVQEYMVNAPNGSSILLIDGPFGAASEDCDKFTHTMLWSAGIGVTPMASILKHIRYNIHNPGLAADFKTERVDFYWVNREKTCFEWFLDLLVDLERTCEFLTIQLFFTGKVSESEKQPNADGTDALTGLHTRTIFARPDFDSIFAAKQVEFQGKKVGVFFCGPPIVSKKLYSCCRKYTDTKSQIQFVYHKENF
jgi:predicted ferric reductase